MLRSHHPRHLPRSKALQPSKRSDAIYGSKNYRDALQRAFNNAKQQVFFNPDMTNFITLTYRGKDHTPEDVLYDIKQLVKKERRSHSKPLKYIYVMEYQKRGSIHVHMIANNSFTLRKNKNNYNELVYWKHGFSSVLSINDFDSNFKPYLYLFKYMKKAQRIGRSFVHSSRNLNHSFTELKTAEINLLQWRTVNQEYTEATVNNTNFTYVRNYLVFDDTIDLQTKLGENILWLEQVRLHSTKELEKILINHSKR